MDSGQSPTMDKCLESIVSNGVLYYFGTNVQPQSMNNVDW